MARKTSRLIKNIQYYQPTPKPPKPKGKKFKKRLKIWIVGLIVLFLAFEAGSCELAHRSRAVSEIKSGTAGYCLDLHHDDSSNNTMVDSWHCNGSNAQAWALTSATIRHKDDCLMLHSSAGSGDVIVSSACNNSADQEWVSAIGGFENPSSALCLSLPSGKINKQLVASPCDTLTTASELWASATWKANDNTAATISCSNGPVGEQVACNAAEQWVAWRSGSVDHNTLLNTYSDGNGYEEWCADFVSYAYMQSGHPFTQGERDGWDEYLADNIENMGFTYHDASDYTPQAGDVAYFDYPGGHVEIVAIGGTKPLFIYGDSGTTDPTTGNGDMAENTITNDGSAGQVVYYLSPS